MTNRFHRRVYPTLVGLLLGLLQTGLFLQLSFTLSSSIGTYLLVTLSWLVGSAAGAVLLPRTGMGLRLALALTAAAYTGTALVLLAAPFQTTLWPLYALLTGCMGLYPGLFFARMAPLYPARALLFMENNGFILGLVAGTLLFMLLGRVALWAGPALIALVLAVMPAPPAEAAETPGIQAKA